MLFELPRPRTRWVPPGEYPDLSGCRHLWCDTEGTGLDILQDRAIGLALSTGDGYASYFPWGHRGGGNLDERQTKRWLRSDQGLRGKHLYFLNAKHDHHQLLNSEINLQELGCELHDIAFPPALLNDNRGYGGLDLESLLKEYDPTGRGKEHLSRFVAKERVVETHSSEIGPYAIRDATGLRTIYNCTMPLIQAENLNRVLELEDSLIFCVAEMERNGLRLDRPKLQRWDQELADEYGDCILGIWQQTGMRINPDSPPEMLALFKKLNLESGYVTPTGEMSFAGWALEKLNHPIINLALKARRLASLRSKYVSKFLRSIGKGDILRYSLHQLKGDEYGTVSGRFSGTNMSQQIMKSSRQEEKFGPTHIIRELVIPDEGFEFFSADAAGIEFRLFVHYSQSERLIAEYRKNPRTDFHQIVTDRMRSLVFLRLPPKPRRSKGKKLSFSKIYGLSNPDSAADQLECSREEAIELMAGYDQDFPEAGRLLRHAMRLAEHRGYVKTTLGRRARFPHKQRLHSALNRVLQGDAADINKQKLREVWREKKTLGIHKLRLTLHDEMAGDKDKDPIYTKRLQELLDEQTCQRSVPILWEVSTGINWRVCE